LFSLITGYFRRPQINKDLKVVCEVIKSNLTERMESYLDAGCTHSNQNVQNLSQCKISLFYIFLPSTVVLNYSCFHVMKYLTIVHSCMLGLQDYLKKGMLYFVLLDHFNIPENRIFADINHMIVRPSQRITRWDWAPFRGCLQSCDWNRTNCIDICSTTCWFLDESNYIPWGITSEC
jgi:hypothetical protein